MTAVTGTMCAAKATSTTSSAQWLGVARCAAPIEGPSPHPGTAGPAHPRPGAALGAGGPALAEAPRGPGRVADRVPAGAGGDRITGSQPCPWSSGTVTQRATTSTAPMAPYPSAQGIAGDKWSAVSPGVNVYEWTRPSRDRPAPTKHHAAPTTSRPSMI